MLLAWAQALGYPSPSLQDTVRKLRLSERLPSYHARLILNAQDKPESRSTDKIVETGAALRDTFELDLSDSISLSAHRIVSISAVLFQMGNGIVSFDRGATTRTQP